MKRPLIAASAKQSMQSQGENEKPDARASDRRRTEGDLDSDMALIPALGKIGAIWLRSPPSTSEIGIT